MERNRGTEPARAGEVVSALVSGPLGRELGEGKRAARAWYAANGDRERTHTTGVWLQKATRTGADPTLVVRVDSGLLAHELGTNKDLYLARMAFQGVRVSDVRFVVGGTRARTGRKEASDERPSLPDLAPGEEARVERACAELPEGLRESVSRAMCASLRRSKVLNTHST